MVESELVKAVFAVNDHKAKMLKCKLDRVKKQLPPKVEKMKDLQKQKEIINGVLTRQKAIAGFWIPEKALYKKKNDELKVLEGNLESMNVTNV